MILKKYYDSGEYDFRNLTAVLLLLLFCFVPFMADEYVIHLFIVCFIWAVVASAWNLIMGFAGIFSFAQLAFFACGGYASGLVEVWFGFSPWIGIFVGGLFAALCGFILAFPCLRVKGLYIVLVTIAFHNVVPIFIKLGGDYTGADVGLMGMPHFDFFGFSFAGTKLGYYYLSFIAFLVFNFIIYRIIHSNMGLAFIALRDSDEFAESLGVNRQKYNQLVFIISAFITGFMGAIYIHYLRVATPRMLEIELFATAIMMVVIGGLGQFSGAILGAFVVTFLNEFLRTAGAVRPLLFGLIIIMVIILFPGGLKLIVDSAYRKIGRLVYRLQHETK